MTSGYKTRKKLLLFTKMLKMKFSKNRNCLFVSNILPLDYNELLEVLKNKVKSEDNIRSYASSVHCNLPVLLAFCSVSYKEYKVDTRGQNLLRRFNRTPGKIAVQSTPNGNCLFNSLSTCLYGTESFSTEIRLRTAISLIMNEEDISFQNELQWAVSYTHLTLPTIYSV